MDINLNSKQCKFNSLLVANELYKETDLFTD